jgi:hypothetical protein
MALAEAGEYDFSLCGGEGSANFDTWLCLFDAGFNLLEQNDDTCGLQSRLTRTLSAGTYHVAVSGYEALAGSFTLAYRKIEAPPEEVNFAYSFGNICGRRYNGPEAELFSAIVDCRLATTDNTTATGAQAWSVGVTAPGAQIVAITTQGTVAALLGDDPPGLRQGGFELSELTSGPSNDGAVSTVTLSFGQAVTLPPSGSATIAKIEVQATYPAATTCRTARLEFTDDLVGSGPGVLNRVEHDIGTQTPTFESCSFELCGTESSIQFTLDFDGPCDTQVEGSPGSTVVEWFDCTLTTARNPLDIGARGWEIGMSAQGGAIVEITTNATAGALMTSEPPGRRQDGFEVSEVTTGAGNTGAVSAVVLSFTELVTLPPAGIETIARIAVEVPVPNLGQCIPVRLFYQDELRGGGQPIANSIAFGDFRVLPVRPSFIDCTFQVCGAVPSENYVAYDCNGDGSLDISDAVCHLEFLFGGGGSALRCPSAMDFNGDSQGDISDPVAALSHLFLGGPASPSGMGCQSYPDCEQSPSCD